MKLELCRPGRAEGSVLMVVMGVLALAAIALASYFVLVQNQTASVARSQVWNSAIPVSEAGIEEGLAMVNKGAPNIITDPWAWTNTVVADGWSSWSNGQTSLTRTVSGSNYYTAIVSILSGTPTISSVGIVPYTQAPWVFGSSPGPFLAAAGLAAPAPTSGNMARKVVVQTVLIPLFSGAIITKSNFDMNGNGCVVDSFDSSTTNYSTGGQYDVTKRRANGDVATDSSVVGGVDIGQGNIWGHVMTGPGTQQSAVQIGNHGAVGDVVWQNGGNGGIQSNYWSGDFNVNIPDVPAPTISGSGLPGVTNGVITLTGGAYMTGANPGANLVITGPTTLWVQNSFDRGITIAATNQASLTLYVGTTNTASSDSLSIGGNGAMNSPGYARNLQFYGLPSLTSVSFHGNAAFIGTIYAPQAAMTGGGGGNNTQDTSGSMIVKSVTLNGHWNFHYDESLRAFGPNRGWIARNWTEVKYP